MTVAKAEQLHRAFPEGLQENAALAQYTATRIGGRAEFLLTIPSADELEAAARRLWELQIEFRILGGGSNVLIADAGVSGVVVLNQARAVQFETVPQRPEPAKPRARRGAEAEPDLGELGRAVEAEPAELVEAEPRVRAESGASLGGLARRAGERGFSGLEWAATVPGSVGGAVVGNAGAHGSDAAASLDRAEIMHRELGRRAWTVDELEFGYRTSWLKRNPGQAVVLNAGFRLQRSTPVSVRAKMAELNEYRQRTQPTGASLGSMFVNPPGDYAGRLIEAVGLKGARRGAIEISRLHANFFLNHGGGRASDVYALIQEARQKVSDQFGVELELEIELLGNWERDA